MRKWLLIILFLLSIFISSIYVSYIQNTNSKIQEISNRNEDLKNDLDKWENETSQRLFDKNPSVSVSNSNTEPGTCVYKAFDIWNNEELKLDEFTTCNGVYLKKVISYEEYSKYKKLWNGIRELTEDDFINYYLVIIVNKNISTNKTYTFKNILVENACLNLYIKQRDVDIKNDLQEKIASGITVVIPNRTDFEQEKINIIHE